MMTYLIIKHTYDLIIDQYLYHASPPPKLRVPLVSPKCLNLFLITGGGFPYFFLTPK